MAQDFWATFHLGEDEKHISAVDGIGISLAAIQGLNERLKERDSEIATLKSQIAQLQREVATTQDISARLVALERASVQPKARQTVSAVEASR